jgi:hypothetical protein
VAKQHRGFSVEILEWVAKLEEWLIGGMAASGKIMMALGENKLRGAVAEVFI